MPLLHGTRQFDNDTMKKPNLFVRTDVEILAFRTNSRMVYSGLRFT